MRPPATYAALAVAAMLQAATASCAYKDIECPAGPAGIEILFEWDRAPRAEVEGMTLLFYPTDGQGRIWRFEIAGRDGGRIEIPPGTYRMVSCNNDLPGVSVTGTAGASTVRAEAARHLGVGVYGSTGMVYRACVGSIGVSECGVRYTTTEGTVKDCGRGLVRCRPDSAATVYTVDINRVTGIGRVRSASLRLATVRQAVLLESGLPAGADISLYMPLDTDPGHARMTGSACAFGTPEGHTAYTLTLTIDKTDGTAVSRTIEIGPGEMNILSPHNVLITISGLTVPDGGSQPGDVDGIEAAVDGWETVEIAPSPAM